MIKEKTHAMNLRIRRASNKNGGVDWGQPIPGVRTVAFTEGRQRRRLARLRRRENERKAKEVTSGIASATANS